MRARAPALVERPAAYAWVSSRMSNLLVGTWRLVSWENRSADGTISYPLGEDAVGFILYTDDGYMAVAIMRRGREPFAAGDLLGAAARRRHHVEVSLFPNWSGVDQERLVEVAGDRLTLSTRPMLFQGIPRSAHLVWERV